MDLEADHHLPLRRCVPSIRLMRGLPAMKAGLRVKPAARSMHVADAQHRRLVEGAADHLQPERQPVAVKPAGTEIPGSPARFDRHGEDVVQIHGDRDRRCFSPIAKAADGAVGVRMHVAAS